MFDERRNVLWIGEAPGALMMREFANRRCIIERCDPTSLFPNAGFARSVVVNVNGRQEDELIKAVGRDALQLVDHGLRVDVIAPDDAATGRIQDRLGTLAGLPSVGLHTAPQAPAIAEVIARYDAGKVPRLDLDINTSDDREPLREADKILFKRAFPHCSRIALVELGGGRSAARVFAVHMIVDRSNIGAWPQPAFAKLDRRDKIAQEHDNYRNFAERFIPFGLRPNIDELIHGSQRSLLVGSFVDRSESLWTLARRNVAGSAITALLDETLGGWRDQGYASDPVRGAVAVALRNIGVWNPDRIDPCYVERAAEAGIFETPETLWTALASLEQTYRRAPIHGDLHGDNVRVRGSSAILIDLASVTLGPLTADLAALEAWLAFELPPDVDQHRYDDPEWTTVIERLYAPTAFRHPPGPARPATRFAWIEAVVRQIRTMGIAIQTCPGEYQTAVAVQLLRRCQWADGPDADRGRRARGYRIAARLVADLCGGAP
ncbi:MULTISPECIES: phosphotransferase [Rhizobium]|uniref:phosphotransferase n=1 Tax=Rhizobium TaxID=379 RepID=UPI000BBDF3D1|nr:MULTISPECIES: phosphotransferase [Rhizobium]PCK84492.1 hypothetical protein CPT32_23510 [Rhizobium sophoriradicis]PDS73623.1 hypothetical protein CO667_32180 [Rhizobium sp. L43]